MNKLINFSIYVIVLKGIGYFVEFGNLSIDNMSRVLEKPWMNTKYKKYKYLTN